MNEYTKFMVLPYIPKIENPQEKYLLKLDQEMFSILNNPKLNLTQKVVFYNRIISQYKDNIEFKRSNLINDTIPTQKSEHDTIPTQKSEQETQDEHNNIMYKHRYDTLKTPYMNDNFDYEKAQIYFNRNLNDSNNKSYAEHNNNNYNFNNLDESTIYGNHSNNFEFDDQEIIGSKYLNNETNNENTLQNNIINYSSNNLTNNTDNFNNNVTNNAVSHSVIDYVEKFKDSVYFKDIDKNKYENFINNKTELKKFNEDYNKLKNKLKLNEKKPTYVTKQRNILISNLLNNSKPNENNHNKNIDKKNETEENKSGQWLTKSFF
jgi:hypothetical protein